MVYGKCIVQNTRRLLKYPFFLHMLNMSIVTKLLQDFVGET
jgi:hypothetical protein